MVQINGESYKVRTRDVNGQEQQIYYKNGKAYVKDEDGNLQLLRKSSDGIFKKATYETAEYAYEQMLKEVQTKNSESITGVLPPDVHYSSELALGKTATFKQQYYNSSVTGKIVLKEGDINSPLAEPVLVNEKEGRYNNRSYTKTSTYGFNYAQNNSDATVRPLEETVVLDDGTVLSKTVYDWTAEPATKTKTVFRNGESCTEISYFHSGYESFRANEK